MERLGRRKKRERSQLLCFANGLLPHTHTHTHTLSLSLSLSKCLSCHCQQATRAVFCPAISVTPATTTQTLCCTQTFSSPSACTRPGLHLACVLAKQPVTKTTTTTTMTTAIRVATASAPAPPPPAMKEGTLLVVVLMATAARVTAPCQAQSPIAGGAACAARQGNAFRNARKKTLLCTLPRHP